MMQATNSSFQAAFTAFEDAHSFYIQRKFKQARACIIDYKKNVDYSLFAVQDNRNLQQAVKSSVVLVSYGSGEGLIRCIQALQNQRDRSFEIIVVDNGKNESGHATLSSMPILWIQSPINLLPSEGRNLGASFTRGEWLIFLDDDALVEENYTKIARTTMETGHFIAIRGKVTPIDPKTSTPPHYDLGNKAIPSELNIEGNMVIQRQAFMDIGGFDPLMRGHEGKELTQRCQYMFPKQKIFYWPTLRIQHDFATGDRLEAKKKRQETGQLYLTFLKEDPAFWTRFINKLDKQKDCIKKAEELSKLAQQWNDVTAHINLIHAQEHLKLTQNDGIYKLMVEANNILISYKDRFDEREEARVRAI